MTRRPPPRSWSNTATDLAASSIASSSSTCRTRSVRGHPFRFSSRTTGRRPLRARGQFDMEETSREDLSKLTSRALLARLIRGWFRLYTATSYRVPNDAPSFFVGTDLVITRSSTSGSRRSAQAWMVCLVGPTTYSTRTRPALPSSHLVPVVRYLLESRSVPAGHVAARLSSDGHARTRPTSIQSSA